MIASPAVVPSYAAPCRPESAVGARGRYARGRAPSVTQRGIARVELAFVLIALAALAAVSVPSFRRISSSRSSVFRGRGSRGSARMQASGAATSSPCGRSPIAGPAGGSSPPRGDSIRALGSRVAVPRADSIAFGPDGLPGVGGAHSAADADRTTGVASRCVIVGRTAGRASANLRVIRRTRSRQAG
jgi:hypothetical protein